MNEDIVTIATFPYPAQAELAKLRLEAAGIESIIANDLTSQMVFPPTMLGGVKVMVRAEDAERATEILQNDLETVEDRFSWQADEEIVLDISADNVFAIVQQALNEVGKTKKVSTDALTVEGSMRYYLNRVDIKVEVRPKENGSMICVKAHGQDVRAVAATKCIDRLLNKVEELNGKK